MLLGVCVCVGVCVWGVWGAARRGGGFGGGRLITRCAVMRVMAAARVSSRAPKKHAARALKKNNAQATYDAAAGEFVLHTPSHEASKIWIGGTGQHGKV